MKKESNSLKNIITVLLTLFILGLAAGTSSAAQTPVNLGTAGNFVILAKSGISTTGTTSITGDIGVSPIDSSAITGFGLIMDSYNKFSTSSLVTGKIYAADYTTPTPTTMTAAISDMETAYTDAAGRTNPTATELYAGDITGKTITPGLYKWGTGVMISAGGVTLSGGANDVWIFQIAQDLTVDNGAIVTLSGGAQAKNIFWQVAGQTTLGTTSNFKGIILSKTLISMNTGATLNGRALAQTAVTLNANAVTAPSSSVTPTNTPTATSTATPMVTPIMTTPTEQGKFRVGPSVTLRPVTDVIGANQDGIVELFMNNPSLNEVTLNVDACISVPSGIHVYGESFGQGAGAGVVAGTFSVPPGSARTIIITVKADKSARIGSHTLQFTGLYWPDDNKDNFQPLSLTYSVNVKAPSKNPDSPEPSNPEDVKGTPTPAIPIPTSTIQMPDVKIRAQLQVTYEVGSLINDRVTIKVFLKNVGDATASNINLTIEHPHELEPIAISGSEKIGDTIAWKGELSTNEEHISEYSVKAIIGKDIEIPLKVTYAKITPEEKARALGISPYAAEASINPQDLETILMIIKILKEIPGFTALAAIMILALVTIILRREKA